MTHLVPMEQVKANDGYEGDLHVKFECPSSRPTQAERLTLKKRVMTRQEKVNRRFKQSRILKEAFHYGCFLSMCHRALSAMLSTVSWLFKLEDALILVN